MTEKRTEKTMDKTTIYLIRHGTTAWNQQLRYQGRADNPLDEAGERQGALLENYFSEIDLDLGVTSPLQRAKKTLEYALASQKHPVPVIVVPGVTEIDFGEVDGLTREEIREKTVPELDAILDRMFSFDSFAWQAEKGVRIDAPFRADGLHRILYKCPRCLSEGQTEGKGTALTCRACGAVWTMDELGRLHADTGETRFPHIPDWYAWERAEVRRELSEGKYRLDCEVEIGMLVDFKAIYRIGPGRLVHDESGFTLTGADGKLTFRRPAKQSYSLYADYYWYELGDMICIGDTETQYYCFPKGPVPVAKARLAVEELYKLCRRSKS